MTANLADLFLFAALPYLALVALVFGSIYRYRTRRFTYSALSSQFLESRALRWGTVPFHVGILVLFLGHLVPFVAPRLWRDLTAHRGFLLTVETVGIAAAVLAAAGLMVLLLRRVTAHKLQGVSTVVDLLVVLLLLLQVMVGLGVALSHRWGAVWSVGTTTPYLWSLLALRPDIAYVAALPPLAKLHLVGAWVLFLLVPFSRLVHVFSLPLAYLLRPPQRVVWATRRRLEEAVAAAREREARRHFLKGAIGVGAAGVLLSLGVLDQLFQFFQGPRMSLEEETELLSKRLRRLERTAEERQLELERKQKDYIRVARVGELSANRGKYFVDYQMRPALAFRQSGGMGLPLLISAKCTHLGCTVASEVDARGRLLCPCHISYFDLKTGEPNPGSPAEAPLPHLGWVLRDADGKIVLSRSPSGEMVGDVAPERIEDYEVWIARSFQEPERARFLDPDARQACLEPGLQEVSS